MTLMALFPDRTSDTPRDFEFAGEWYVMPSGRLMFCVKTRTGWELRVVTKGFREVQTGFPFRRRKKFVPNEVVEHVPTWHYDWLSEDDFVDVHECGL